MNNADMKTDRFYVWARARKTFAFIQSAFAAGDQISIGTYTHLTTYKPKHASMFKATRTGIYVQRGKRWDYIGGCSITRVLGNMKVVAGRR
jgi:hypothetical protein